MRINRRVIDLTGWVHRKRIMRTASAPAGIDQRAPPRPPAPSLARLTKKVWILAPLPITWDEYSAETRDLLAVRDQRDRAAFARLFDHFAPRLKAMLMRGSLPDGPADDIVQDVMLAVWHKAGQFDPHRADAAGWIYGIARNRRIDLARRRPLSQPDEMPEIACLDPDPAQKLALQQEVDHLKEALSRLAPEQADALRAAYFDDMPHSRISELTGLPLGTIKSRIRLGLERLRHELKKIEP